MMIEHYKQQLPDYAKDLKLNLSSVLETSSDSQLTQAQIFGIALACAYTTKDNTLIKLIDHISVGILDEQMQNAIKAAASIMAMNNIYYRFVHLSNDHEYKNMPAKLRMNIIANPQISKIDFELYALAVSAINGCGLCMASHAQALNSHLNKYSIQHAIRIAAVIHGLAQVNSIAEL